MQKRPEFPARLLPEKKTVSALSKQIAGWQTANKPARNLDVKPVAIASASSALRARMVQRLVQAGIQSSEVLAAMSAIERDRFVDSALSNRAYEDTSLPIGLAQTISKPSVVARMLELLLDAEALAGSHSIKKSEVGRTGMCAGRVLEIGTGCGYQTALLAKLVSEVYSMERLRGLHERARTNLRPLRLANVHLLFGDGMLGFVSGAPYAGILAAAGGAAVPGAWCDQLSIGGRLVAPLADSSGAQSLIVIDRTAHGWTESRLEAVHFVPLKSGIS